MTRYRAVLAVTAASALVATLFGGSALSANADTPEGPHVIGSTAGEGGGDIPWNSSYYLQGYTCPGLVALTFRGSGEGRIKVNNDSNAVYTPNDSIPVPTLERTNPSYQVAQYIQDSQDIDVLVGAHSGGPDNKDELVPPHPTDQVHTNGWEGPTIQKLIQAWTNARYFPTADEPFPFIGVGNDMNGEGDGYPAIGVSVKLKDTYMISASGEVGAEAAVRYIQTVKDYYAEQGCKTVPHFMVIGYSQGAFAARRTAIMAPNDVLSSYLLGDPWLSSDKSHQRGDFNTRGRAGATGTGMLRSLDVNGSQLKDYQVEKYDATQQRFIYCHKDDIFCDFQWLGSTLPIVDEQVTTPKAPHSTYYAESQPSEATLVLGPGGKAETNFESGNWYEASRAAYDLSATVECIQALVSWGDDCNATSGDGRHTFTLKGAPLRQAKVFGAAVKKKLKAKPTLTVTASVAGRKSFIAAPALKGATYRYDFDGNGKWDLTSKKRTTTHVYKKAGTSHLKVQVKKGKSVKLYRLTVKTVAPATLRTGSAYASPAYDIGKVSTVQVKSASSGILQVAGLPANTQYGVRFVKTAGDPWYTVPTKVFGPYTSDSVGTGSVSLKLKGVPSGTYKALIVTPTGYHATQTVKVP